MRIYLDCCCLNRPFDDQSQERIRLESEAVLVVLHRIERGEWAMIGGEVLDFEAAQIRNPDRRARVLHLARGADQRSRLSAADEARAAALMRLGFKAFDALHLACAERAAADWFLTTDDRLIATARRQHAELCIRVRSPLYFLREQGMA